MKSKFLILITLFTVSFFVFAEQMVYVYKEDGTKDIYVASKIDSIGFVKATTGSENAHEWVDLGLPSGTKWATCNVGASSPEEYGEYFAWGETEPKSDYSWSTYKWCNGSSTTMTKYCESSSYGTVDNKTILELSDDAANVTWGGNWRMPTVEEIEELLNTDYCTLTWNREDYGVEGIKITSKTNGKSIFFPTAGGFMDSNLVGRQQFGYYWSRTLNTGNSSTAFSLSFPGDFTLRYNYERYVGLTIRPVLSEVVTYEVSFDSNGGEGTMQSLTVENTEQFSAPSNTFTREGYEFVGWNTQADGGGTSYVVGTEVTLTSDIILYAQWKQTNSTTDIANGHEWVDLGLPSGTKWATCNVGANSPEEYGDYFAWGRRNLRICMIGVFTNGAMEVRTR